MISAASKERMMPSLSVVQTVPSRQRKLAPALSSPPKQIAPLNRPCENHLNPTGTSKSFLPSRSTTLSMSELLTNVLPTAASLFHRSFDNSVDERAADQRLADGRILVPPRSVREQIVDRHREVMIRIHQSGGWRDDAVTVGVGIIAHRDLKAFFETHQSGHGIRTGAIHAYLAVMIECHEAESRIDLIVDNHQIEAVALGDFLPVRKRCAAEWSDPDLHARRGNRLHVDHCRQIFDVRPNQISFARGGGF